jgi:hypothetical protein
MIRSRHHMRIMEPSRRSGPEKNWRERPSSAGFSLWILILGCPCENPQAEAPAAKTIQSNFNTAFIS